MLLRLLIPLLCLFSTSFAVEKFVITPIPKCGSHLLMKCIYRLTKQKALDLGDGSKEGFKQALDYSASKNCILKVHLYSGDFAYALGCKGYKNIFMYRDPRDACVSLVRYLEIMQGNRRDFMWVCDEWDSLSFDERLLSVMTGSHSTNYMKDWYERLINWMHYPDTLMVRYEDLIGSSGGGNAALQRETLRDIADFIGAEYSPEMVVGLHNGNDRIGAWKDYFNEEHIQTFEELYSHILYLFDYR